MMDLKPYGYTEADAPKKRFLPGRIIELRREQYTVVTERGEVAATLKGTLYHSAQWRENKFVDDKTGYRIEKRAKNKAISMGRKQKKKNGGVKE